MQVKEQKPKVQKPNIYDPDQSMESSVSKNFVIHLWKLINKQTHVPLGIFVKSKIINKRETYCCFVAALSGLVNDCYSRFVLRNP